MPAAGGVAGKGQGGLRVARELDVARRVLQVDRVAPLDDRGAKEDLVRGGDLLISMNLYRGSRGRGVLYT